LKPRRHYRAWRRVALRWSDNDVYGHVNNAVYWQWFDTAVNDWLIEQHMLDLARGDPVAFVVETRCRYVRPFSYPGAVEIGIALASLGRSSASYRLGAFAPGQDDAGAEARWTQVCVARGDGRPVPVPDHWRDKLRAIDESAPAGGSLRA
jgi:acyl-CoA thioester hydrolase